MPRQISNPQQQTVRRRKKKKNHSLQYFLLFLVIFVITLLALKNIVTSYTPDVDVQIGNNDSAVLTSSDMPVEEGTIDERLRWIQEEDELPSAGENEPKLFKTPSEDIETEKKESKIKKVIEQPKKIDYDEKVASENDSETNGRKTFSETKKTKNDYLSADFRKAAESSGVIPKPKSNVSKVVIGRFSSLEEALSAQNKVSAEGLNVVPFIKAIKNQYVVQVGSFSEQERAEALKEQLRAKGYHANVISE